MNHKDWLNSEIKNSGFTSVLPEYYCESENSYNDITINTHVNFIYKNMLSISELNNMKFSLPIIEGDDIVFETLTILDNDFYDKLVKFCYDNTYK